MAAVYLKLLTEVFNSRAKTHSFDDFTHWLLTGDDSRQSSMIFQLLLVTRQAERLAAQVERAKDRTKQRDSEQETIVSSEATSAFTNMIDNRVEEFISLVSATAPLVRDPVEETVSSYNDWLVYLQQQFVALYQVDELDKQGREAICTDSAVSSTEDATLLQFLCLQDNERLHMFSQEEAPKDTLPLSQIREVLLYRIQNCLLSRAVTGTFIEHVPFHTDHSAMLSAVATGRFLATHCMQGLRSLHEQRNEDKKTARFSYAQLLELMSSRSSLLDDAVHLSKSDFPIQYTKKITEAFRTEANSLIDEFTKFFDSLTRAEQNSFRSTNSDDVKSSAVAKKRSAPRRAKKVAKRKRKNNNNDDDDDDDDGNQEDDDDDDDTDDDDDDKQLDGKSTKVNCNDAGFHSAKQQIGSDSTNLAAFATGAQILCDVLPDNISTTTVAPVFEPATHTPFRPAPSIFSSPSPNVRFMGDEDLFGARFQHTLASPRATSSFFSIGETHHLDEGHDTSLRHHTDCLNCKRLQSTINDLKRTASSTDIECAAFFAGESSLDLDVTINNMEKQLKTAKDNAEQLQLAHAEEMRVLRQNFTTLQKQFDDARAELQKTQQRLEETTEQLHETQKNQISDRNARIAAERQLHKEIQKKAVKPFFTKNATKKLCRERRLAQWFF